MTHVLKRVYPTGARTEKVPEWEIVCMIEAGQVGVARVSMLLLIQINLKRGYLGVGFLYYLVNTIAH